MRNYHLFTELDLDVLAWNTDSYIDNIISMYSQITGHSCHENEG